MTKTLIYCSQSSEAQPLINFLKLTQNSNVQDLPEGNEVYTSQDDDYLLVISGTGKENCQKSLEFIYKTYEISKALHIGTAGCSDSSIKVGTLFCTNRLLPNINFAPVTTVDQPLETDEDLETLLVDMEAKHFQEISKQYFNDIYTFKVVSDYLDIEAANDDLIKKIIENSFDKLKKYL